MTPEQKLEAAKAESRDEQDAAESIELVEIDEQIEAVAVAIDQLKTRTIETILAIGKNLHTVHGLLAGNGRDGQFRLWVKRRCRFSHQTAYNYLNAFSAFGGKKCQTVLHLFDAKALYALSAESCPEKATLAAIRQAQKGKHIDHELANALRFKYEPKAPHPLPVADVAEPDDMRGEDIPDEIHHDEPGMGTSTRKSKGVTCANEAINALSRIPRNDELRARGFQIVRDWIAANE